jgi:hypothetical protein
MTFHRNLKTAQELGMETIRQDVAFFRLNNSTSDPYHALIDVPIGGTISALKILGDKLGIDLTQVLETEAGMPSKL